MELEHGEKMNNSLCLIFLHSKTKWYRKIINRKTLELSTSMAFLRMCFQPIEESMAVNRQSEAMVLNTEKLKS